MQIPLENLYLLFDFEWPYFLYFQGTKTTNLYVNKMKSMKFLSKHHIISYIGPVSYL